MNDNESRVYVVHPPLPEPVGEAFGALFLLGCGLLGYGIHRMVPTWSIDAKVGVFLVLAVAGFRWPRTFATLALAGSCCALLQAFR